MPNIIQKMIYNFSIASPILYVFSIVWYIQEKTLKIPIFCSVFASILLGCLWLSFSYGKENLAPITIRTNNISSRDSWIIGYIISYILPFTSLTINININVACIICFVIVLAIAYVDIATPHPFLLLLNYHFYSIDTENGISKYMLISKRKIRKTQDINMVKRIFEFLLLDTEE